MLNPVLKCLLPPHMPQMHMVLIVSCSPRRIGEYLKLVRISMPGLLWEEREINLFTSYIKCQCVKWSQSPAPTLGADKRQ